MEQNQLNNEQTRMDTKMFKNPVFPATIVYFLRETDGVTHVLLGKKLKGIGAGQKNSYGGGIDDTDKDAFFAAAREVSEETFDSKTGGCVMVREQDLTKIALAYFTNTSPEGKTAVCQMHVFRTYDWQGEFRHGKDLTDLDWFSVRNLPEDMMLADREWLGQVLRANIRGKHQKFIVRATYGPHQKTLVGPVVIEPVTELP